MQHQQLSSNEDPKGASRAAAAAGGGGVGHEGGIVGGTEQVAYNFSHVQSVDVDCVPGARCVISRDQIHHVWAKKYVGKVGELVRPREEVWGQWWVKFDNCAEDWFNTGEFAGSMFVFM